MKTIKEKTQRFCFFSHFFFSFLFLCLQGLTVTNVKDVMGSHLQDLKLFENDTLVETWVNLQLQSDLDTLGLGLISNRTVVTNPTSSSNSTATPAAGNPEETILMSLMSCCTNGSFIVWWGTLLSSWNPETTVFSQWPDTDLSKYSQMYFCTE